MQSGKQETGVPARRVAVEIEPCPPPERGGESPHGPPIHPLAALILVVVDNLWNLAEWAVIDWAFTIPASFVSVAVPTYFLQRLLRRNTRRRALGLAVLMGGIAAVPTSVTGTPVGIALLAWFGIDKLGIIPRRR